MNKYLEYGMSYKIAGSHMKNSQERKHPERIHAIIQKITAWKGNWLKTPPTAGKKVWDHGHFHFFSCNLRKIV